MDSEELVQRAVHDYNAGIEPSLRAAATAHEAVYSTVKARHAGRKTSSEAAPKKLLREYEEIQLVRWIYELVGWGLALRVDMLREMAESICGHLPSKNWPQSFLKRHNLVSVYSRKLDHQRAWNNDPQNIKDWFKFLAEKLTYYDISPDRLYNMDEKGVMLGVSSTARVIVPIEFRRCGIEVSQPGNRESVSIVEAVCANGRLLPPLLIWKAHSHLDQWYTQSLERQGWRYAYSDKGYTGNELALVWFQGWEEQTRDRVGDRWRMLLMDNHGSHIDWKFIKHAVDHKVVLVALPAHSTHLLQPLDVGLFSPLQQSYGRMVDRHHRAGITGVNKERFLEYYTQARRETFTISNIKAAFKGAATLWRTEMVIQRNQNEQTQQAKVRRAKKKKRKLYSKGRVLDQDEINRQLALIEGKEVEEAIKKAMKGLRTKQQRSARILMDPTVVAEDYAHCCIVYKAKVVTMVVVEYTYVSGGEEDLFLQFETLCGCVVDVCLNFAAREGQTPQRWKIPDHRGDTITVLGRGVQQEAAAKRGPGRPKARGKRRRHQDDEGDTDFEAPVSFNGAVDAGFTRATRFNSGSNSKDHGLETLVQLITSLQNTLAEQRETQARAVKELREQQEQAQKKAAETAEEAAKATKELKGQIESLKEDIKALSSGQPPHKRVAEPTYLNSRATEHSDEEKRVVNIDARRARCEKKDIAKVKDKLERALRAHGATDEAKIDFIRTLSGDRIEVCFETEAQCKQARQNPRWLEVATPGARLKGETWYPIKCDGVVKFMVMDPEGDGQKFRDNVLEEFKKDNSTITVDCEAKNVVWLSKNKDKDVGSLAIWLSRKEAAEYLLQYVTVRFGASAAYSAPFIRKDNPGPCFNCNKTRTTQGVRHAEDPTALQTVDVRPIPSDRERMLNLAKKREVQWSLINERDTTDFDVLLIAEPFIYSTNNDDKPRLTDHQRWEAFTPTTMRTSGHVRHSFRAAVWVNSQVQGQAISVPSPDITAVQIQSEDGPILLFSRKEGDSLQVVVAGDFNRHDQVWGGDGVGEDPRQGEGDEILHEVQEFDLQLMLPRGTPTYEHYDGTQSTTIDLVMTTSQLATNRTICRLYRTEHGSDHRAIETHLETNIAQSPLPPGRQMFDKADWTTVRTAISRELDTPSTIYNPEELDIAADTLLDTVQEVTNRLISISKPSPDAKRPKESPATAKDGVTAIMDEEKADMLMHTFFPAQRIPAIQESENEEVRPIRPVTLTRHEVQEAMFAANPKKTPGNDGLPFRSKSMRPSVRERYYRWSPFEVQGAYNGVNKDVLCQRLRRRRIPEELVATIEYPGLPQGPPLSPILYILYNADLVERPIDSNRGALGFVDDFTAWVTGPSTGPNTRKIQETILPGADKTAFIHFTRNPGKEDRPAESNTFRGQSIPAGSSIKLLRVVLDKQLDMKLHMARVATKASKQCLAIKRLRGLRPQAVRQLYIATVTPIIPERRGVGQHIKTLTKVQRLGAQAITRAFRTVARQILEVEANLQPTEFRLRTKSARHLVKCYTLPKKHPARQCLDLASKQGASLPSPMAQNIRAHEDALQPSERGRVEVIQPKKRAKQLALDPPWKDTLYTDGSYRNNRGGAAVVKIKGNRVPVTIRSETTGTASSTSILATELHAVVLTLEHIQALPSREALRAIQTLYAKSGQYLVQRAAAAIKDIQKNKSQVQLTWTPAHSGIPGNEAANSAALKTTERQAPIDTTSTRLWTQVYRLPLAKIRQDRLESFQQENVYGKYTRRLDGALPGRHTLRLYGALSSDEASVLMQCRSNHSFLRTYLARIGREQSGRCECGQADEMIRSVLAYCPRWQEQRQLLIRLVGARWLDMSYMLGGWSTWEDAKTGKPLDGPKEQWKPNMEVVRAVVRFLQSTEYGTVQCGQQSVGNCRSYSYAPTALLVI
ncbi:hypothetical protein B0A49_08854 [Cryomyces minteri]|uniref:HTH CENPB-type domain-containing protein n=1 Tax=Cryomyces minteri TaxID=331657 RepID=A0A4U0WL63_9PEZI|nr:hypothetical protein B0A49_08854 [Cryomyces minteri]